MALRLRAELRARWRSWVAMSVLVGVVGGTVLAAAAGARRTATAYTRFRSATDAPDIVVSHAPPGADSFYREVAKLPGVVASGLGATVNLSIITDGAPEPILSFAALDTAFATSVNRPKILRGRPFSADRPEEAMVDERMAQRLRLRPGSSFELLATPLDEEGNPDPAAAARLTFRVSAIVVFGNEVVPINRTDNYPQLLLTPAFATTYGAPSLGSDALFVRLRSGTDRHGFRQKVEGVRSRHPGSDFDLYVADIADQAAKVERAIVPQAIALAAFAVLVGLIGLVVTGQMLSRQVVLDAVEYPILRTLGMENRQLAALSMVSVVGVSLLGACIAAIVAIGASPIMPIGPARLAEPHPGLAVHTTIVALGFGAVFVLLLVATAPAILKAATRGRAALGTAQPTAITRLSRLAAIAAVGRPVSRGVGVRMALEPGQGRSAVPVRSAMVGTTAAIAAMVTALVFGANLTHLIDTPRMYGQTWDIDVDGGFALLSEHAVVAQLSADPDVVAYAGGTYGEVGLGGQTVAAVGIDLLRGEIYPTMLEGRPTAGPEEVVLGTRTLRRLHRSVGQTTDMRLGDEVRTMRIVGRAVFPSFGRGVFTPTGLGEGAAVVASLLPVDPNEGPGPPPGYNFYLLRLREGARPAAIEQLAAGLLAGDFTCIGPCHPITRQRPTDIGNYARVRQTPLALGVCLGLLAVATLAHTLLVSIHRRRRELATLKAMGFLGRQMSSTLAWQATTLVAGGSLLGLPLGVAAGRWAWALFASSVGVAPGSQVPWSAILAAIVTTMMAANLIAAAPGWWARRLRTAAVLRAE